MSAVIAASVGTRRCMPSPIRYTSVVECPQKIGTTSKMIAMSVEMWQ